MRTIPDSGTSGIRSEEWLVEMERFSRKDDEGLTMREISDRLGKSIKTTGEYLIKAHSLGWLHHGFRSTVSIDGKMRRTPVYIIRRPAMKKAAKKKAR